MSSLPQSPTWTSTFVRPRGAGRCRSRINPVFSIAAPSLESQRGLYDKCSRDGRSGPHFDVVLSSGFLAFANHTGFLQAIDDAGVPVSGIMGTSAGALSGSLYAAGLSPKQVANELSDSPPADFLRLCIPPVRHGSVSVISLHMVVERLKELLPATFEELKLDFAVGTVDRYGRHVVINSGPLPEAVAASAAIPYVFAAMEIPGQKNGPFRDGGLVDRTGLKMWRNLRRQQLAEGRLKAETLPPVLLHLVERSSSMSGNDDVASSGEEDLVVVRSPRAGVNFFSLGNFVGQFESARMRTCQALAENLLH